MSDDSDNNQDGTLESTTTMAQEWSRVMTNPDNLIVSDVLRAALPDEFSSEENVSSILDLCVEIGELEVTGPLTRLDMSRGAWLCQMSVDASDAAVILSYTLDELHDATIQLRDKGNSITTFEADTDENLTLSVDTDGRVYYITLTCEKSLEDKNES